MLRNLLILLASAALLAACGPKPRPAAQADPLANTSWLLATLGGAPPATGTSITLNFGSGGVLAGSDGCNDYSAGYTLDGSSITILQPISTTRKACPEPVMQQSSAYLAALGKAARYAVQGESLTLSDSKGTALATYTAQSQGLGGTSWDVISYNNGQQAVVSVMADTQLTANFGADGNLTGFAGCNDYNATYTVSGTDTIQFGPVASTRKACDQPPGVMDQETQYLAALSTAATYTIDADQLEMRTADGAIAASFQRSAP
jgi:heat shock protein HslJ